MPPMGILLFHVVVSFVVIDHAVDVVMDRVRSFRGLQGSNTRTAVEYDGEHFEQR